MVEMHERSDVELLRDYAEGGHEAAFRELVARHTDFVFSAALRQVNSPDLAGDIAQGVFTDLARKAQPLGRQTPGSLAGWLHRSTRYAALNHLRDTRRRLAHERQAMEQLLINSESAPDWERIRPVLDEALDSLGDEEREALLLRYFKNQDFRAVGLALGVSDDTAQKRVSRAVERLREFFSKRNVTIGASGLAVVISANAVQAAPAGLAAAIAAAALAGTAVSTSTLIAATKTIAMTTIQKTLITAVLAVAAGAGIYEAHQAGQLREQNQTLQQQQAPLAAQIQQLQRECDAATNRLADSQDEMAKAKSNNLELLKLRGEVSALHRQLELEHAKAVQQVTTSGEKIGIPHKPGSYIAKGQLVNASFDTPEAATETYFHASWSRDFHQFTNAISTKMLAELQALTDPKKQEEFERKFREQDSASGVQGIQLLAKNVSDDRVDVVVLVFEEGKPPSTEITKIVKEGNLWKFAGTTTFPFVSV